MIRVNVFTKSVHSKIFNKLIVDIEQQSIFECNIHENDEVQAEDEVIKKAVLHMNNLLTLQASPIILPLFDLLVKGQGQTNITMVRETPSYSHIPTYQISLTYL